MPPFQSNSSDSCSASEVQNSLRSSIVLPILSCQSLIEWMWWSINFCNSVAVFSSTS